VPLIFKIIDREVRAHRIEEERVVATGIRQGEGIRQGMPISPLLANLVLAEFDCALQRRNYKVLRYADDLILFFSTENECREAHKVLSDELAKISLSIPRLGALKTEIVSPNNGVDFLGREIVYLDSTMSYVARIAPSQIEKISSQLRATYTAERYVASGKKLEDLITDLSQSVRSYLGIYRDAENFARLNSELRGLARSITSSVYAAIFGFDVLSRLGEKEKRFLGIQEKLLLEPEEDLEVVI
jgi:hypothetical protein